MPPVRFATVGIGGFGRSHLRSLADLESRGEARLDAVVVIDPENHPDELEDFARRGVRIFNRLDELLKAGEVDIITLPVGIHFHVPLSIQCLRAGYDVVCEKPLTAVIQDANYLIDVKNQTGKHVLIGYQSIYTPAIQTIKTRLLEGRLGRLRSIRIKGGWPRPDAYYARNNWAGRLKVGDTWVLDSPINNAMAHDVNNALYLCGPTQHESADPRTVQAEFYRARPIETLDTACLRAYAGDNVEILILLSHITREAFNPQMVLTCEKATVRWSRGEAAIAYTDGTEERLDEGRLNDNTLPFKNAADVFSGRATPLCPPEVARAQTLCINAAHESCPDIADIPGRLIEETHKDDTGDRLVFASGLDDAIHRSFDEGKLFSELGIEWAHPTSPFDTEGYAYFPGGKRP